MIEWIIKQNITSVTSQARHLEQCQLRRIMSQVNNRTFQVRMRYSFTTLSFTRVNEGHGLGKLCLKTSTCMQNEAVVVLLIDY